MKKKLAVFVIALLMFFSGGLMFACGGKATAATPTKEIAQIINDFKSDEMFEAKIVDSLSTAFSLKALNATEYDYFTKTLVVPLEYISSHTNDVENLENLKLSKQALAVKNQLGQHLTQLKTHFTELSSHNKRLAEFDKGVAYQGALSKYLSLCQTFASSAYDVAFDIAKLEAEAYGKLENSQVTSEALTSSDSLEIKDYLMLDLSHDIFNLLVVACQSESIQSLNLSFLTSAKNALSSALGYFSRQDIKVLTGEQNENQQYVNENVTELLNLREMLQLERKNLNTTLERFSFKDIFYNYNGDIDEYKKDNTDADKYISYLVTYYASLNGILSHMATILF